MSLDPASTKEPMRQFKIVIEKHSDGYVAYPIGIVGAIVGQGETYEEALSDVKSAIACYAEVFGKEKLDDTPYIEVFVTEAGVAV
jgi:predicted RNase H-like HicB family nuclease